MNIAILYRTHSIQSNSIASVPRIFALLVKELSLSNPDFKFFIGCPAGESMPQITKIDIGESYLNSTFYKYSRLLYRRFGLNPPEGKVSKRKVNKFLRTIPTPDVIICSKISDLILAHKSMPKVKKIWWHLGIEQFNRDQFKKALRSCNLIAYTGSDTYKFVFNKIMPDPFPLPVLIAHGPYDIKLQEEYFNTITRESAREKLQIPRQEIIILHIGGNRPEKGIQVVDLAIRMVKNVPQPCRLISIGNAIQKCYSLHNDIIIDQRGFVKIEELYLYYLAADIGLVLPLWKEPGPAVLMEMMFFKVAVIASLNGGVNDILGRGNCIISISDPNSVIEFAYWLERLILDEDLRLDLSITGRQRAMELLAEPVIENWSKILRTMALS